MKPRALLAAVALLAAGCASAPKIVPRGHDVCRPQNWQGYRHADRCWEIEHPVEAGLPRNYPDSSSDYPVRRESERSGIAAPKPTGRAQPGVAHRRGSGARSSTAVKRSQNLQ